MKTITKNETEILNVIDSYVSVKQLKERTNLNTTSLCFALMSLEQWGLIHKEKLKSAGAPIKISLTQRGKKIRRALNNIKVALND